MTTPARERGKIFGSLAAVLLSSTLMVWLLWRHPLSAGLAAIAILAAFGISAHLARWIEPDPPQAGGLNRGG